MSSRFPRSHRHLLATVAAAALTGCTVGPSFHGAPNVAPGATRAASYHRAMPGVVSTAPTAAQWWETLRDPQLNQVIETALINSPDIHAAEARLKQARAGLRYQKRNALPKPGASAAYLHADLPT